MRRRSIATARMIILTLVLCTAAMAADPLVGTWKLNVAKSKTTDPSTILKSEMIKIVGIDNGFKQIIDGVDADGKAFHFEASRILDGKEYPIKDFPSLDMTSAKRIDANTIEFPAAAGGLYSLSPRL